VNLTELTIKNLKPPDRGQILFYDDAVKGFGVRVSQGGTKTFVLVHGQRRTKITIGRVGIITLAEARGTARTILAEKTLGKHRNPSKSFDTLRDEFLAASKLKLRPRTVQDYTRLLARFKGFGDITRITAREITQELYPFLQTPGEANHLLVALKAIFSYAVAHHYLDHSPAAGIPLPSKRNPRNRVLSDTEIKRVWNACADDTFGRTVRLLLLTGCRRSEIQHLELEFNIATLPKKHSKNHRDHVFPVPAIAVPLLKEPLTFNGWSKSKRLLDQRSGVSGWVLHDLRRTYATIHARLHTPPHIIERLLNHVSGEISGVAAVYNRHHYLPAMGKAVDNYDKFLQNLLRSGN
jgi:integrase